MRSRSTHPVGHMPRRIHWHSTSLHGSFGHIGPVCYPNSLQTTGRDLAMSSCRLSSITLGIRLGLSTEISTVDIRLLPFSGPETRLNKLFMNAENVAKFLNRHVVQEDAFAELSIGNRESLFAVSRFPKSMSSTKDRNASKPPT